VAQFQAKPLSALEAIYRFVGGLGRPPSVDLASPIALVHDVATDAVGGASLVFNLTHSVTTAGAGVAVLTTIEIADIWDGTIGSVAALALASLGRRRENSDVYLLAAYAYVTAPGTPLIRSVIGFRPPNNGRYISTAGQTPRVVGWGNVELATSNLVASGQLMIIDSTPGSMSLRATERLPARVETVFQLTQEDSAAAVTVTYGEVIGFFPIGTPPRIGS